MGNESKINVLLGDKETLLSLDGSQTLDLHTSCMF